MNGAALRYKYSVSIEIGDIMFVSDPYSSGGYPSFRIYWEEPKNRLHPAESLKADTGYAVPIAFLNADGGDCEAFHRSLTRQARGSKWTTETVQIFNITFSSQVRTPFPMFFELSNVTNRIMTFEGPLFPFPYYWRFEPQVDSWNGNLLLLKSRWGAKRRMNAKTTKTRF